MSEQQESAVKRYDCTGGGVQFCQGCYQMEEDSDGDYVKYDDYATLQSELSALRKVAELTTEHVSRNMALHRYQKIIGALRAAGYLPKEWRYE